MGGLSTIATALATAANAAIAPRALGRAPAASVVISPGYAPFSSGALGSFPYYWQTPSELKFNATTYQWIGAGLKAGANPVELDGVFANRFISALSSIVYMNSTADQAQLVCAQNKASNEQRN